MTVQYSRRALSQLASLHEYLVARNTSAARSVGASIRSTITRLQTMPRLGRKTDEQGVHVIIEPQYGYRVFYTAADDNIFVLRILHGRQR